ncbi:MAG: peptide deformylase [Alphaproteobacteria bacterium]|nr:peptide deformylase [Alphaproteobacteria bacterium]
METKRKLTLVIEPDPILHQVSEEVKEITSDLNDILDEMASIMGQFDGIGLAAPQVGILKRMIIIDAETIAREDKIPLPKERYLKIINPEIIEVSRETCLKEEGCLSLPTIYYTVERPEKIRIKYFNEKGEELHLDADGLLARCIEHEIDHLNGKIFIDYVGPLKRKLAISKLKKMKPRK